MENYKDWLRELARPDSIPAEDIPDIGLYMDQVTTLMDTKLARSKRYPDDKIMTKTMINNYTKNHLLPPSSKKKYSREHIFLLIMIYYLKNMLSISDIQSLLAPLSEKYFPTDEESGFSLADIYKKLLTASKERQTVISDEIVSAWEDSRDFFKAESLPEDAQQYLDDFYFIFRLGYDIYVRKQIIERLIDKRREESPEPEKGKKAKKK